MAEKPLNEIILEQKAVKENFPALIEGIRDFLAKNKINKEPGDKIVLACEEIIVNTMDYAYLKEKGNITVHLIQYPSEIEIIFIDSGIPFNPLAIEEPDISLSADEREEGGLGIHIVRSLMDSVFYEYDNNKNILALIKKL